MPSAVWQTAQQTVVCQTAIVWQMPSTRHCLPSARWRLAARHHLPSGRWQTLSARHQKAVRQTASARCHLQDSCLADRRLADGIFRTCHTARHRLSDDRCRQTPSGRQLSGSHMPSAVWCRQTADVVCQTAQQTAVCQTAVVWQMPSSRQPSGRRRLADRSPADGRRQTAVWQTASARCRLSDSVCQALSARRPSSGRCRLPDVVCRLADGVWQTTDTGRQQPSARHRQPDGRILEFGRLRGRRHLPDLPDAIWQTASSRPARRRLPNDRCRQTPSSRQLSGSQMPSDVW